MVTYDYISPVVSGEPIFCVMAEWPQVPGTQYTVHSEAWWRIVWFHMVHRGHRWSCEA